MTQKLLWRENLQVGSNSILFHFIPLLALSSTIFSWWIDWISSLSSLSAATKLLLLSLETSYGLPLMATIQLNAFRKSVVLNEKATSKYTALVVEQVSLGRYSLCNLGREGPCMVHTIWTASLACLFSHGLHSLSNSSLPADPLWSSNNIILVLVHDSLLHGGNDYGHLLQSVRWHDVSLVES